MATARHLIYRPCDSIMIVQKNNPRYSDKWGISAIQLIRRIASLVFIILALLAEPVVYIFEHG